MGLWSSTFGGGNSFEQSVSNQFGGNKSGKYEGGSWQSDAPGHIDNEPIGVMGPTSIFDNNLNKPEEGWAAYHGGSANSAANSSDNDGGGYGGSTTTVVQAAPVVPSYTPSLGTDQVLQWATDVGLVTSQEEMQAIIDDPDSWLAGKGLSMADVVPSIDADAAGTSIDGSDDAYAMKEVGYDPDTVNTTEVVPTVSTSGPVTYTASTASDKLTENTKVDAATGTIDSDNLVDADNIEIDVRAEGEGTGVLGNALNEFATQDISTIIDTSTISGKLLADKLGEGNYTDHKATTLGQMKIISAEFSDSNGNPVVPAWAQGTLREVRKSIAFSGISGTAAIAAYSNAIMEATLGVASEEAAFFQTLTVKNLDNRQQAIINKAQVLSNFELSNLSAREAAAVQNAQSFLQMDLSNLTNEQQAEIINKQAMVQALLEDQGAINAQRIFTSEQKNEFATFYDNLNTQIQLQNATEINALKRFNAGEINDAAEFNSQMDAAERQFYANMQFNIDSANAKWRQSVLTTNTAMIFEAMSTDVKNRLDLTQEAQNRLWDSIDNLLDYAFKGAVSDMQFETQLLSAQLGAQANAGSDSSAKWGAFGTITAAALPLIFTSDTRLKKNIVKIDTLKGINFYQWEWNEEGIRIGANKHPTFGVLAQEIQKTHPEAVKTGEHGYLMVNYGMISNEV